VAKLLPPDTEMIDVETEDGEELAIFHDIESIPALICIMQDADEINAFLRGWHGEEMPRLKD